MVKVYFETLNNSHSELVAKFDTEELFNLCRPILAQKARESRMMVTESIIDEEDLHKRHLVAMFDKGEATMHNLTINKEYPIVADLGNQLYSIIDDDGCKIIILKPCCSHINDYSWIIKEKL